MSGRVPPRALLLDHGSRRQGAGMLFVCEVEAIEIHAAFDRGGEFSAAVELRGLFPAVTDNAQAR